MAIVNLLASGHVVIGMTIDIDSRSTPRRLLPMVAATVLIALGLAACGSSDGGAVASSPTSSTTKNAAEYGGTGGGGTGGEPSTGTEVVAKDFSLTSVKVAPGAEVTFANQGQATHTMTADDGSFDTERVAPGATAKVTAPSKPGSYAFHCKIHPSMTGTLTVTG